jgi:Secretion system C-terminal sorting domain
MQLFTKIVLVAAIAITLLPDLFAQPVQSFCSGPASLQNLYNEDAWYIAHDVQSLSDSIYMTQTLDIPTGVQSKVLDCLLAVYNADLPARDTVIQKFNIHALKKIDLQLIELYLDTSHAWTHKILENQPGATGNVYMDSLANRYGFEVEFIQIFPQWVQNFDALVRIKTSEYVNTEYLAEVLGSLQGVAFANAFTYGGDGNRIFYKENDTYTEITYRHGWEDCPAGCINSRDWLFRVYDDCSVEFMASYGDLLLPTNNLPEVTFTTKIFPNPASDQLNIEINGLKGDMVQLQLLGVDGRQLEYYILPTFDGQIAKNLDISDLNSGVYNLTLTNENQVFSQKFVVIK